VDLPGWLRAHGGIASRSDALAAGFRPDALRSPGVRLLRRRWLATDEAPHLLVTAAEHRARITCASLAAQLGLAVLRSPADVHLAVAAHSSVVAEPGIRLHRASLLAPPTGLTVAPVDMLAHVATCLPRIDALVLWESAIRKRFASIAELARIPWAAPAARELAGSASAQSDSVLETVLLHALRGIGIHARQQVTILGRRVDFLIGDRLIVQTDGFEHHRAAAQRHDDLEHDARAMLEGYRVIRLTYVDVIHDLPRTLDLIRRALAQRLHLA
jgi:very-short-patch-repair endonuclease